MFCLLLGAALRCPAEKPLTVEVLELNQVFSWHHETGGNGRIRDGGADERRRVRLSQWIIWEQYRPRDANDTGWHVWCWRRRQEIEVVMREKGFWKLHYRGRPIVARVFRTTWTEYDPEILDAHAFPKNYRRKRIEGWQR